MTTHYTMSIGGISRALCGTKPRWPAYEVASSEDPTCPACAKMRPATPRADSTPFVPKEAGGAKEK
jgi:hypothetical protein